METFIVEVIDCSGCGENHEISMSESPDGGNEYDYNGICEKSGKMIYAKLQYEIMDELGKC